MSFKKYKKTGYKGGIKIFGIISPEIVRRAKTLCVSKFNKITPHSFSILVSPK
jgi:hypothetical protein